MAGFKIAGIMRSGAFSPNHIGNDATIFNMVADQLRKRGCELTVYTEEQFAATDNVPERIIVSMCREPRNIERTMRLEDQGRIVVNSGYGIANCTRERMTNILKVASLPIPDTFVVDTDEVVKDRLVSARFRGCWVKRADIHTQHREDVTFARHPQEAQEIVQEFFLRGIKRAIISRHCPGALVKVYGVTGSKFFHWLETADLGDASPSAEDISGKSIGANIDVEALRRVCTRAAEALDVRVYGCDCVISPEGDITIVNFNDWPSFAPCRSEAASAIARYVIKLVKDEQGE